MGQAYEHELVVPAGATGRLDAWLSSQLSDQSRARLQGLIKEGAVTVDGAPTKASHAVAAGQRVHVRVAAPVEVTLEPEPIPFGILFEDADIVVVDKPPGLVVHPAAGHAHGTLVNGLLHHCTDLAGIGGELRPGIVHRLDRDTSGVMVVAKHEHSMRKLVNQFKQRDVHKEYMAIVRGIPIPGSGTIETLIGRSERDRKRMSTEVRNGKPAVTHYQLVEVAGGHSLVAVHIETGRTHQIRVHMSHIGHPVLGDAVYGRRNTGDRIPACIQRQMLHARYLTLVHPRTGEEMTFEAPLPVDMVAALEALRKGAV
jgi:23S rRNA pseudouridine1911/1915/1917 synthase